MRREGPLALCLILGIIVMVANFFESPTVTAMRTELDQWFLVVQAFIVCIGAINVTILHGRKITMKREGWIYSVVCLAGVYGMILFGLTQKSLGDTGFNWVYNTTIDPMTTAMFGLLMFYIGSAAYRSFRVRTKEATVLLLSAVIVMLGRVPIGAVISPEIPKLQTWIMTWPNTAGMRAIGLGAAFGAIATAFRVLIGIERSYIGAEK